MVRVYSTSVDTAGDARAALIEFGLFLSETDLNLQCPTFDEWYDEEIGDGLDMYENMIERLQDDLTEDEGLRMINPETAARYGLEYKGRGADRPYDMELAGVSSGGKRVALRTFEGVSLEISNEALAEQIDPTTAFDYRWDCRMPNLWCRQLMAIMDELDEALTEENAERCGRYYATDYIARELGLFD